MKHYNCGTFGEYKRTSKIKIPKHWETGRSTRYFDVDKCIKKEIKYLIRKGVRTVASCCGHGKRYPSVIVDVKSKPIMASLGYKNTLWAKEQGCTDAEEYRLGLLPSETIWFEWFWKVRAYFWMVFSIRAFRCKGFVQALYEDSKTEGPKESVEAELECWASE